jgi:selenocysteine-specific elongation factor
MKRVILGTAGHIDHGKTSLIKALTGIDTDRLKEEKERGITIELGFANLTLPSGQIVGVIDVPGHERFVKNMVAGAATIDLVALVVAADEGVMPQTREHLEICQLLRVKKGLVALTKIDMVDEEWMELVIEDLKEFLTGTFLENSPIIPVSAVTGQGLDEFAKALEPLCAEVEEKSAAGAYRLPVDRVFTMKGFGTVITGTSISGSINVGDTVSIFPRNNTAKVRGLQVHGKGVEKAEAGLRTAINLQGLEKDDINRGDVIATENSLKPSYMVDVHFDLLKSARPLKSRGRIRFHTGTVELLGYIVFLDREELQPGESAFAQIRLEEQVAVLPRDHYVIRSYSPVRTIGGGEIVAAAPPKHKRFHPEIIEDLEVLLNGSDEDRVKVMVSENRDHGISRADLTRVVDLSAKKLDQILQQLQSRRDIICFDKERALYVHAGVFQNLADRIKNSLGEYHNQFPLRTGMKKDELRSKIAYHLDVKLFNTVLKQLQTEGEAVVEGDLARLESHKVKLREEEEAAQKKLEQIYLKAGLEPPYFRDIAGQLGQRDVKEVVSFLLKENILVKVKEDLYFHAKAIEDLKKKLVAFLTDNAEITTSEFKQMTGVSRKYMIPLFEYFDSMQITMRVGEKRVLRSRA